MSFFCPEEGAGSSYLHTKQRQPFYHFVYLWQLKFGVFLRCCRLLTSCCLCKKSTCAAFAVRCFISTQLHAHLQSKTKKSTPALRSIYLFILRSSMGCRAANRSNSFLIISVWKVEKRKKRYHLCDSPNNKINVLCWAFHLKSREVRSRQVAQVILRWSVPSGFLLNQRCSLPDEIETSL